MYPTALQNALNPSNLLAALGDLELTRQGLRP
jgi:hypothetical protein